MKLRLGLLAMLAVAALVWLMLQEKSAETATTQKQQFDVELQTTQDLEKLREQQLDAAMKDAAPPPKQATP